MASTPVAMRRNKTRAVLAWLAILGMLAWVVLETEPRWRRYVRLWTAPAPHHLPVPVQGVAPRAIADTWHAPRDGGSRRHMGLDIFAKRGTPVISPVEGIVIGRGRDRLGGNVVRVLGPGRQVHYFAHLEGFSDARPRGGDQSVSAPAGATARELTPPALDLVHSPRHSGHPPFKRTKKHHGHHHP